MREKDSVSEGQYVPFRTNNLSSELIENSVKGVLAYSSGTVTVTRTRQPICENEKLAPPVAGIVELEY